MNTVLGILCIIGSFFFLKDAIYPERASMSDHRWNAAMCAIMVFVAGISWIQG